MSKPFDYAKHEAEMAVLEAKARRNVALGWLVALAVVGWFLWWASYVPSQGPGGLAGYQQRVEQVEERRELQRLEDAERDVAQYERDLEYIRNGR
jgi:hypothetical protein